MTSPTGAIDATSATTSATTSPASAATESVIRESLAVIRPGAAGIAGSADLAQEADLDSVGVMDLIMEIEDRLDLSIPVEIISQARSIDELLAGIVQLQARPT